MPYKNGKVDMKAYLNDSTWEQLNVTSSQPDVYSGPSSNTLGATTNWGKGWNTHMATYEGSSSRRERLTRKLAEKNKKKGSKGGMR
jgi:hypothetical protein